MDRPGLEAQPRPSQVPEQGELPATAYPHHRRVFANTDGAAPTGLLFDSRNYAIMAISQPAGAEMPDLSADKDGDRVLVVLAGDLVLQIGENRFRMTPGDAVQIPRGVHFGRSRSQGGAHLLLIRSKALRSFSMYK